MGFIIFLAAIIAFYVYAGKKWKDETKRRFKIVVCGISLLCTVFLLLICISGAKDLYETEKDRSLSARMDSVEYELRRGDYIGAVTSMQVNHDYEEEFSYIWERCEMYMTRNYCALYKKAAEENEAYRDKAAEWEQKLKEICENSAFPAQNARYGEYFQNSVR